MTLELRPYQREALDAVYEHLRARDDNPCVVIPTGGGKTPILAELCHDAVMKWRGRVLVLSHVKELLEQAANHLASFLPINMVGIHSAGLGRRDTTHPVIVAGIQTVADKAGELGAFDLIVVDECHLLPESGEGRYLTFLRDAKVVNPNVRIIGLTATPFRLGSGRLCKPGNMLNHVCYEANVKELILQGWLIAILFDDFRYPFKSAERLHALRVFDYMHHLAPQQFRRIQFRRLRGQMQQSHV